MKFRQAVSYSVYVRVNAKSQLSSILFNFAFPF